jgi:hypothetical protein
MVTDRRAKCHRQGEVDMWETGKGGSIRHGFGELFAASYSRIARASETRSAHLRAKESAALFLRFPHIRLAAL